MSRNPSATVLFTGFAPIVTTELMFRRLCTFFDISTVWDASANSNICDLFSHVKIKYSSMHDKIPNPISSRCQSPNVWQQFVRRVFTGFAVEAVELAL